MEVTVYDLEEVTNFTFHFFDFGSLNKRKTMQQKPFIRIVLAAQQN